MDLREIVINLESLGLTDVLIPFILIFTIIYAISSRIGLFKKNSSMLISLAIALLVVIPHVLNQYPPCWDVVLIINNALPKIAMVMIAIISFFLVLGVFGMSLNFLNRFISWIVIIILGFVTYTFLTSRGQGCYNYEFKFLAGISSLPFSEYVIPILSFIVIVWFITKSPSKRSGLESGEDEDIY